MTNGIVIVGGGLAAARTAEQLRRAEYTGPLTIVSDEVHLPYDRPPLSKEVLRAEVDDTALKPREWYDEKDITLRLGAAATGIDTAAQTMTLADGTSLIAGVAARYGAQAAVVCLPVKKKLLGGYRVVLGDGKSALGETPEAVAAAAAAAGAGEIIVYAIDRDGTFAGFDLDLLKRVAQSVDVPVVACGGARNLDDLRAALVEGGCSAVAAGSMFVYQSQQRGVLISYPPQTELVEKVYKKLA